MALALQGHGLEPSDQKMWQFRGQARPCVVAHKGSGLLCTAGQELRNPSSACTANPLTDG